MGQRVYLNEKELDRIRSLYGMAWGYQSPTHKKLERALAREQESKK